MEPKDDLLEVMRSLWRWRRPVLAVVAIAALGSLVVSLLLPVYYEATTVFLAASTDQSKPEILYSQGAIEPEYYGSDADIDRLLTLAQSRSMVTYIVDRFQLMAHYRINPEHRRARHRTEEAFFDLYRVKRTERDAIELSVEDRDPRLAAEIANAVRDRLDTLAQALVKTRQQKILDAYNDNVLTGEQRLAALADTLSALRQAFGIFNIEAQSESLTEQMSRAEARLASSQARLQALNRVSGVPRDTLVRLEAEVSGQRNMVASIQGRLDRFNEGVAAYSSLQDQFDEISVALGEDQERLQHLLSTFTSSFPAIILVEPATLPEIKKRPQRALIVVATTLLALIFSLAAVLLLDAYRDLNWRSITHGP